MSNVTDLQQALIWKIPNGGGKAEVWYTHPDLDSIFGPNGIRFADNGRTLLFAVTLHPFFDPTKILHAKGRIYKISIDKTGKPGKRELIWEGKPGEGPDGFTIGESGKIYVSLALPEAMMILSPNGKELNRTPATLEEKLQQEVSYSSPANVAFHGKQVLVTNQDFFVGDPQKHVVFKVYAGEHGKPLFRPYIKQ
ncbi:SMP-30/gluconolactonase/LRE family protein [Shimazuella kribbensis]|uniref:SMP-30/gluconolactonase/LRE family protein n=1 Tax=Shimazuella kribbensis TaxID=139808 RepID=UPI00040FB545|nr:SMP-30/gluconolactonase/LRE family protein [Shimazuella kribbensis]